MHPADLAVGSNLFGELEPADMPRTMVRTKPSMGTTRSRGFFLRALPFLLVVPLIAIPAIAYFALTAGSQGRPPLAQGSIGGSFHPVAGNFEPDTTQLDECEGSYSCLEQAFGNIAFREGPKQALNVFDVRIVSDVDVERDCHRIAHNIGSAAFARYDGNVARTFAEGSATCASGYYHGILERAFVGATTKAQLAKLAKSICVETSIRRRGFLDYQCRHGLGHGFMIQTGYDLPTALSLCGGLGTGWDEVTCTSGAFMENVSTRFGFRSQWLRDDDPLYPCGRVQVRHRRSCFVRATTRILLLNGNDFEATARTCESAGLRWARFCFRGYGRDAVVEAKYVSVKKVLDLCRLAEGGQSECLFGAARTFADGAGLQGAKRAAAFCARAPRMDRPSCVSGLGIVLGLIYPTDASRRAACARLSPGHVDACTSAAIAEVDPSGRTAWG